MLNRTDDTVGVVCDGAQELECIQVENDVFELVVSGIRMPKMDGIDMA